MKTRTKLGLVGLAGVLVLSTACSSTKGTESKSTEDGKTGTAAKGPVPITIFMSDLAQPLPDQDIKETKFVKYVGEKTNTQINMELLSHGQYVEKLRLKFASGDLPDVFQTFGLQKYAEPVTNGQALSLDDLIAKYGPNLKKVIPQSSWDAVTINGKIMAIPDVIPAKANYVFYVRKDWLDKLGMKVPTTSDEMLDMWRAFRDKDPNGNGKPDELPFSMREKLTWWENILGMWGLGTQTFHKVGNEVMPDIINPKMKDVLTYMNKMYSEKLLDPEFLVNTNEVWQKKITSDLTGSFVHQPGSAFSWNDKVVKAQPTKKPQVAMIPTPRGTGYDGKLGAVENAVDRVFVVMKNAKQPEAIVKMFDWLVTDEGQKFSAYGFEGDTVTTQGDKFIYDEKKDKDNKTAIRRNLFSLTLNRSISDKQQRDAAQEEQYKMIQAAYELAAKEGQPNIVATMPTPQGFLDNPNLKYDGTLFQEAAAKIIAGKAPIDSFDEFVKTYRKQGGDQLVKEITDWYNNNNKK